MPNHPPERTRRHPCLPFEDDSEVLLALEPHSQGDLDDREIGASEQLLGSLDSPRLNVTMRRNPDLSPEGPGEVPQ